MSDPTPSKNQWRLRKDAKSGSSTKSRAAGRERLEEELIAKHARSRKPRAHASSRDQGRKRDGFGDGDAGQRQSTSATVLGDGDGRSTCEETW